MITNIAEFKLLINEGLIKTYNINDTIRFLKDEFSSSNIFIYKTENKIKINIYEDIDIDVLININTRLINLYGWFPSNVLIITKDNTYNFNKLEIEKIKNKINNISNIEIYYEAKYDNKIMFNNDDKIYHITPTINLDKILNIGLVTKTNYKGMFYKDRIYFMLNKEFVDSLLNNLKLHDKERVLKYKKLIDNYFLNKDFLDLENNELNYSLLEISNLDRYIFYKDINYSNGVYTLNNINPKDIKINKQKL